MTIILLRPQLTVTQSLGKCWPGEVPWDDPYSFRDQQGQSRGSADSAGWKGCRPDQLQRCRETHRLRLSVGLVQVQPRLRLPLFQHLGVQGLPSRHAVLQLLEFVPGETVAWGFCGEKSEKIIKVPRHQVKSHRSRVSGFSREYLSSTPRLVSRCSRHGERVSVETTCPDHADTSAEYKAGER